MKSRFCCLLTPLLLLASPQAFAQGHTERGAVIGGIAGALTGSAIGKHNGETGAGALIGTAVGVVTGAAIGSAKDEQAARIHAQHQESAALHAARAVSMNDVMIMTQNGVSDSVIINHISQHGVQRRPEVADVLTLHQNGVSEVVITAMQRAPVGGPYVAPAPVQPQTHIIREHYYTAPVYRHYPRYRFHHHHHHHGRHRHHHHGGASWRVSVGF